jgi:hypothetical protein
MQDHSVDKIIFLQGLPMTLPVPSSSYSELSSDRLQLIAESLLDLRFDTLKQMSTEYDGPYTQETAVFGRSRAMLISMALSGKYEWMTLSHAGMDVTFNIGSVPCRFFRDDPDSPAKGGFFRRNAVDSLFAPDDTSPVMWRFIVEMALSEEDEDSVVFAGYNVYQEKVSEWVYEGGTTALHSVGKEVPQAAEIRAASVSVREDEVEKNNDLTRKSGNSE